MVHIKVLVTNLCNWIQQAVFLFVQTEMYTVARTTVLEGMGDKSQFQTESRAEGQVLTNRELWTSGGHW